MKHVGALERFVAKEFPTLGGAEPQDVVSEAIRRFWKFRKNYDGSRALRSWLYGIVKKVAMEFVARRYRWMKAAALESACAIPETDRAQNGKLELQLDAMEAAQPKLEELAQCALGKLKPLQREILEAYAFSGSVEPDAASLGRELGRKHDGVPIPAGTIRVYKLRAKEAFVQELAKLGVDVTKIGRLR